MNCAISQEQQKRFGAQVAKDILESINSGENFDAKSYMQSVYNQVMDATGDHARALDYARLAPIFMEQVAVYDTEIKAGLRGQSFSMDTLADLVLSVSNTENGLTNTEAFIEVSTDITEELAQDNANVVVDEQPVEEESAPEIPEAQPPTTRQPFTSLGQRVNDFIVRTFKAYAPTALADRIQEALAWSKTSENYNVPNPQEAFYFKVKRRIVEKLASVDYDSGQMDLDGMGPVFLTAMSSNQIQDNDLRPGVDTASEAHKEGVVLMLTDRYGMPIRFDVDGKATIESTGKAAYYYLRQTDHIIDDNGQITLAKEDKKAVKALAKQKRISEAAAEQDYKAELQLIADMRKYIRENKEDNTVQNIINGGTQGYIEFDYGLETPISKVEFGNQAFEPYSPTNNVPEEGLKKGRTYFKVDSMYGQYVEVERPTVLQAGVGENLASLLVDSIVDQNGIPVDTAARQKIVDDYIKTGPEGVQIFEDPNDRGETIVKLRGKALPIGTPEEKASAKANLMSFFNEKGPAREISQSEIGNRRVVQSLQGATRNQVLEVADGENKKYYVIDDQKLHINKDKVAHGDIMDFTIEEDANGNKILTGQFKPYKDFIKDKFFIHYGLNKQNKLVKLNAYFTFQPQQEALDKMYGTEELEAPIEEAENNTPETGTPNESDPNSSVDDAWDGPEFFKNIDQSKAGLKATKEQIASAKKWYEKSPLSKHIPFEVMFNAVNTRNPHAVASWALHGITLFKGADYSDLYHEGFHAFTQTFMTKAQRASLYNEARKKSGSFMDYKGHRVQFASASDKQLEEYMAEDFRKYMLNGNKPEKDSPARNTFFRKLLDMLKAFFSNSAVTRMTTNQKADKNIREVYNKLRVGNLSEYTFSQENAQFGTLNKGVQAFVETEAVAELSYENSRLLTETMDSLFSEFIDLMNAGLSNQAIVEFGKQQVAYDNGKMTPAERTTFEARKSGIRAKATFKYSSQMLEDPILLRGLYKHARIRMSMIYNQMNANVVAEENESVKARLQKDAETLHYAIRNFGDVENLSNNQFEDASDIKGMIGYHMNKSEKYFEDALILDFENMSEEDTFLKGREGYDRNGNETSMQDLAKKEIIHLLKSVHKIKDGEPVLNKFGVPELINFQEIWNRLARTLQNQPSPAEMERLIKIESENYKPFQQLIGKLGPLATGSKMEVNLWTNFWQTFNLTRVPLIQMTIEKSEVDGKVTYQSNIGEAFADYRKVGRRWESEYHTADHNKSKYISNDKNGNYLNLDAILNDFKEGSNVAPNERLKGRELEFFHALGFKFTDVPEIRAALTKSGENVRSAHWYKQQLQYLANRGDIQVRNFSDLNKEYDAANINGKAFAERKGMKGRFKNLQVLEARYSDQHSNYMVTNAENNTQFEHTLNNSLTIMVNTINNSKSYQDLVSKPHMAHLNVEKNPFAKASAWLNSIYTMDVPVSDVSYGKRRRVSDDPSSEFVDLRLTNLSGVLLTEEGNETGDGIASAKADEFTKLIMDFHMVTQAGIPELMRHADKGTSFSAALSKVYTKAGIKNQYIENTEFLAPIATYHEQAMDFLLPQIKAELERIGIMRGLAADGVQNFDFKYLARGQNFVAFDDVLSPELKAELIALQSSGMTQDEIFDSNIMQKITEDTQTYFQTLVDKAETRIAQTEFVSDSLYADVISAARKSGRTNVNRSEAKGALVKSFVYNSWIHNIESLGLIYGDLAQYNHNKEEFHKRNAGAGSTGKIYRTDKAFQDYVNSTLGRAYTDKVEGAPTKGFDGTFDTGVVKDNEIGSVYYKEYLEAIGDEEAAKAYAEGEMNEGDAQGVISFDAYRILKSAEGSWSIAQENLYQDIVAGKTVRPQDVNTFFPTVKAQYFGALANETALPITAFHKFSLFPLIPTVIKGTNLEKLHNKMVMEGMDYVTFESGSKVGTITKDGKPDKIYDKGRDITAEPFTKNKIFLEYLKDQLEIAPKYKENVIFSTQLRKLIEDGLYENGKALTPEFERLVTKYEADIRKLTQIKKKQLLEQLNWTMTEVNGKEVVEGDIEPLMKFVKSELTRQDLADHEIDFIQIKDGRLKHDLSLSLSAEKIEKLLNAIITKRLVKQKINGEGLIQVSGALFEQSASTQDRDYDNPTDEDLKKWGTNDLPTYHKGKNGKTQAMKVKIAMQGQFLNLLGALDKEGNRIGTVEKLNELIRDEEWMNTGRNRDMVTMVGVRIPVQGLNSMEFMEVYEFLPAEAGNIIVPPAEIVAKSGSDFDIDKLTVMMPNIRKANRKGPARMYNYTSEDETRQAYEDYKKFTVEREKLKDLDGNVVDMRRLSLDRENDTFTESTEAYDRLLESIFGYSMDDIESDLENILLEEGDLKTYEEFKLSLDGSKAIENDLIMDIKGILELPANYSNLIRPNGTDIVQPLADELAEYVMDFDPKDVVFGDRRKNSSDDSKDAISPTRVFEIDYNLYKHSSNNIGKQTLGLGAVDNTYNSIFNRIGAHMNPTKGVTNEQYNALKAKERPTKEDKKVMNAHRRQMLLLPHNTIEVDGQQAISLSNLKDKDGEHKISDVINQLINGWVDIAKDAWIFNIQGNKEVAPSLLFMIQAGVPVKDAVYFASSPMVRDYVREQRLAKSTFADPLGKAPENPLFFRNKAREEVLLNPKYGYELTSSEVRGRVLGSTIKRLAEDTVNTPFERAKLLSAIKAHSAATKAGEQYEYTEADRQAFIHFIEIEDMSKAVRDIKLKMNFDTSKSGTLFEAQNRILMKEGLKQDDRIPSTIVDDILTNSPIGSFYIQPFQLAVWKDVFGLRNHDMVNKFLLDKFSEGIMNEVRNTFGENEKFANEFRNDLMSFIFQNALKDFNRSGNSYRGNTIEKDIPVDKVTNLKFGAYVKDGVLYVDSRQLNKEFKTKEFTRAAYAAKGLAKVNSTAFQNVDEYHNFVYEREMLRDALPYNEIKDTVQFIQKRNIVGATGVKRTGETTEAFTNRLDKEAYEIFLRDTALDNIFNHFKLFKSQDTYADQFNLIRASYPELMEDYALMKQLSIGTSKTGFSNLKLNDTFLDGDTLNLFHENLINLSNPEVKKVDDPVENQRISDFFSKLPTVAFLQSGMSTKSAFSLTRIVPEDSFIRVMEKPVKDFIDHLDSAWNEGKTPPIIEEFFDMFVSNNGVQNRATRIRGKSYLTDLSVSASEKMMTEDKKRSDVIDPMIVTDPLQTLGAGLKGYNPTSVTASSAKALVAQNPERTYIYNYALDNQNNATVQDRNFYGTDAPNTVGLPTRLKYAGGAAAEQIKDVDGQIDPRIKAEIDSSIDAMKQQQAAGQTLIFSMNGYGQYMLGASDVALTKAAGENVIAPQTFLYLSKRLFEEFGYINPNYLMTKTGRAEVQSSQPVTDKMVEDFMNHCIS
jgi:hypothetical protein